MKVVVTRQIPEVGIELLKQAGFETIVSSKDGVLTQDELKEFVKGADAILSLLTDKIDASVLDSAGPQLKVVANYAVGYDNINIDDCKAKNVIATNTPGVLTETVAEHTIGLLFAVAQNISQADKYTREGKFMGWGPMLFLGTDVRNKTIGIIGLGRIGLEIVKRLKDGFGINFIYYDLKRNEQAEKEFGVQFVSLEDLMKNSDFVSIHVPLTPETKHLIGEKELRLMKKTAYLINTSRGAVIEEAALVKVLQERVIAGAGLDVYENEPKLSEGLAQLDNVVLLPHIASASFDTRSKMSEMAAQNIVAVLGGQAPINPIV
ncbi:MAG TPA: D-glycerate dehydrogenase [Candidatus Paceibacterota bacterium]|nr:D-glycerate dehydrogenase [Candidatus Paceibacterota bacterium]HPT40370.1 D-glycerate dehydrogenase [Candidatus Paceibacterota bacterium]